MITYHKWCVCVCGWCAREKKNREKNEKKKKESEKNYRKKKQTQRKKKQTQRKKDKQKNTKNTVKIFFLKKDQKSSKTIKSF